MTHTDDRVEWAQEIRHIAERLEGAILKEARIAEMIIASVNLHDLADRVDPGSGRLLDAYVGACDDSE